MLSQYQHRFKDDMIKIHSSSSYPSEGNVVSTVFPHASPEPKHLHGTTERDPTQKRHDFHYFSRSRCFVLVENMKQELATIHALEHPITKGRDGVELAAWPVLHCHP